ncbi:MAG: hypothetical protein N2440_01445 [Actinobacteria bacterium]|nr:hypothetical protein [Actinomycetota bacterium]
MFDFFMFFMWTTFVLVLLAFAGFIYASLKVNNEKLEVASTAKVASTKGKNKPKKKK